MKALALLALCAGCGGALSASEFQIAPLPAMVTQKSPLPLVIVAKPGDVPDHFHVAGKAVSLFYFIPDVDVTELRTFVTRDLQRALAPYFASVTVVDGESKLPKGPYLRADVVLSKLEYEQHVSAGDQGQRYDFFAAVEWAFSVRSFDSPQMKLNFSDRAVSPQPMENRYDTSIFAGAFQEALRRMLVEFKKSQSDMLAEWRAPNASSPVTR